MQLKDMTAEAVMLVMDVHQPNWWIRWADQQDLIDASELAGERQKQFLRARSGNKVMLVLRSAWVVEQRG